MQQAQRARVPDAVHDVREAARQGEPLVRICPACRAMSFIVSILPLTLVTRPASFAPPPHFHDAIVARRQHCGHAVICILREHTASCHGNGRHILRRLLPGTSTSRSWTSSGGAGSRAPSRRCCGTRVRWRSSCRAAQWARPSASGSRCAGVLANSFVRCLLSK